MHPGMMAWLRAQRRGRACDFGAESWAGAVDPRGRQRGGPGFGGPRGPGFGPPPWGRAEASPDGDGDFGGFGVRRPLRFLAYKLELNEEQVAAFARVLDDLKTERAQAAVDHRRTTAAFAEAMAGDAFDQAAVNTAAGARVNSSERLRDAIVAALGRMHAILTPEQRGKLAYLLRTGALSI